jgi:tetratricopeptide (TPR) repeat protein
MGVINTDPNRKVVPRWRSFTQTLWRGELLPVRRREPSKVTADKDFQDKIDAWNQRQTIVRASELVCSALVLGRNKEAVHAADYILRRKDIASAPLIEVSKRVVGIEPAIPPDAPIQQLRDQEIWYREINRIRNRLIREPRNAVLWVDLSRLYEILGCRERAERAIRIALALYPHNRFVLRSAVRLFVHQDRIRQAHRVLRRASSIAHDPWLIAVDIVLSSILSSPQIHAKRGRAMLSADIAPFHLAIEGIKELDTFKVKPLRDRLTSIASGSR